ncbi:MAG TPA: Y-family DNA polymerase [Flavitalea sp.]|nr:Y-family DNA polymerase [Flavitalea sp.]
MYALVDCNNFYCSCERVFNPKLNNRPVVVLSNNDGCAIARSEEAKAIGVAMGAPAFMIEELLKKHNVAVFSSNYTLYGDMSDRVMKTLATFCPRLEIYSIDEAFLDLHDMPYTDLLHLGMKIRKTIKQNTGIPTSVGIAETKTLAKMANRYAKKHKREVGVFWAANSSLVNEMLRATEAKDIWGIGGQYAKLLQRNRIHTAYDLSLVPEEWVRVNMSVVGQRLLNELRGIPAIESEYVTPDKKNICTSRSFGKLLTSKADIQEALSNFVAICALKLRKQKSCCKMLEIFIQTNPHKTEHKQYMRSIRVQLDRPSNNTSELIKYAIKGLDIVYKEGYLFKKTGIFALDLVPENAVQSSLFDTENRGRSKAIMEAMDGVNRLLGKDIVRIATQGYEKRYRLRAAHLSPSFTTNIDQIIKVR